MSEIFRDIKSSVEIDERGHMCARFVCDRGRVGGCASVRRDKFRGAFAGALDPKTTRFGYTGFCQRHTRAGTGEFSAPLDCEMDGSVEVAMGIKSAALYIDAQTLSNLAHAGITIEPGNPTGVVVNMADQEEQT